MGVDLLTTHLTKAKKKKMTTDIKVQEVLDAFYEFGIDTAFIDQDAIRDLLTEISPEALINGFVKLWPFDDSQA